MANIALRNPQFKFIVASAGARSVVCKVTIDGTLRYTLTKNVPLSLVATQTVNFDIAELARDYIPNRLCTSNSCYFNSNKKLHINKWWWI